MENLLIAWGMFLRGKKHRKDVIKFQAELAKNLAELYTDLKNRTYIHGTYSSFNISDPKPRNIHKANVRDRVLLGNLLLPIQTFLDTKLKLKLHPNKVYIKACTSGFDFLGWVNFPYHRQIRTTTKRRIIKNLRGYPKKEVINSYRGLLSHGNTYKLQKHLKIDLI